MIRRIRILLSVIIVLFIAYCFLDAGYSYWTDSVSISGNVKLEHKIRLIRKESVAKESEASDENPEQKKQGKTVTSKKDTGTLKETGMEKNTGNEDKVKKDKEPTVKVVNEPYDSSKNERSNRPDPAASETPSSENTRGEIQEEPVIVDNNDEIDGIVASVSSDNAGASIGQDNESGSSNEQPVTETDSMESETGTDNEVDDIDLAQSDEY